MSLTTQLQSLVTRIGSEFKTIRTLMTGSATGDLSGLNTTAKTSLIAAINEARTTGGVSNADLNAALSALVASAPGTLDTLNEIAAALGNDPNFAASMSTALGNRVRTDAAQGLTGAQKLQARQNIDAVSTTEVGDTTTDFVAAFNAAIA